jgi:hypothetical protein
MINSTFFYQKKKYFHSSIHCFAFYTPKQKYDQRALNGSKLKQPLPEILQLKQGLKSKVGD